MTYKIGDKFKGINSGLYYKLIEIQFPIMDCKFMQFDEKGSLITSNFVANIRGFVIYQIDKFPWEDSATNVQEAINSAPKKCTHEWIETVSPFSGTKWKDCKKCGMKWEDFKEEDEKTGEIKVGKDIEFEKCHILPTPITTLNYIGTMKFPPKHAKKGDCYIEIGSGYKYVFDGSTWSII